MTVLSMSGGALRARHRWRDSLSSMCCCIRRSAWPHHSCHPSSRPGAFRPNKSGCCLRPERPSGSCPLPGGPLGRPDRSFEAHTCGLRAGNSHSRPGIPASMGFRPILGVSLLHAFALAPTTILADALALVASKAPSGRF